MDNNTVLVTDNQAFIRLLLDNACAASVDHYGIKTFYIETHCVGWWVEAYKKDGAWVILKMRSEPA